jgi:hypothetical protein
LNYANERPCKKTNIHWSPYVMLVRENAFISKQVGNHVYLDATEICRRHLLFSEKILHFKKLLHFVFR